MPVSPDDALGELQRQFVRELLYRDAPGVASRIEPRGLDVQRRLAIYRTNARENFALALEAAFPLLLRCLGPEEFRRLAWTYQRACPSPAGNLFHAGRRLPGFLAEHVRGTADGYLIDVARLEWAVQESMVAADGAATLDLTGLAAVPPGRLAGIRFRLHPSARLLRTDFAVFAPWEALQAGQPVSPVLPGREFLLVLRRDSGVQLQRLPGPDLAWLEALEAGATLADAVAALPPAEQAALGDLLVRSVASGALTSFD